MSKTWDLDNNLDTSNLIWLVGGREILRISLSVCIVIALQQLLLTIATRDKAQATRE